MVALSLVKKKFGIPSSAINNYMKLYVDTTFIDSGKEWLNTVTVKGKKKRELGYDEKKRVSRLSKIITSDKFHKGGFGSISNAVLRVPGLQMINGYIVMGGISGWSPGATTEPIIVMDGIQIPMTDEKVGTASPVLNFLNHLEAGSIDFIEVLTGPEAAIYGNRSGNGVILINTKITMSEDDKTPHKLKTFIARGYHAAPPFPALDYNKPQVKDAKYTDLRATLYWNGNILTNSAGKIQVEFFTADVPATYKVLINGITVHGDIIHKDFTFSIKNN